MELLVQFPGESDKTFYSVEYRKPLGADSVSVYGRNFKNIDASANTQGVVAYLHSAGLRQQYDDIGLFLVQHLAVPGDLIVDLPRNITIDLVEELPDNRARVRVTYAPQSSMKLQLGTAGNWSTSTATLTPVQESGVAALKIDGKSNIALNGCVFSTSELGGATGTLAVYVKLPANPPNPYRYGDLRGFASCPSAGVYNKYLGYVGLTGLPTNQFQTVTFAMPSSVLNAFNGQNSDCSMTLALNVDGNTPASHYLANLRFVN